MRLWQEAHNLHNHRREPAPLQRHFLYCHPLYCHPLHRHSHLCSACSMLRRKARFSSYVALLANSCWNSLHIA